MHRLAELNAMSITHFLCILLIKLPTPVQTLFDSLILSRICFVFCQKSVNAGHCFRRILILFFTFIINFQHIRTFYFLLFYLKNQGVFRTFFKFITRYLLLKPRRRYFLVNNINADVFIRDLKQQFQKNEIHRLRHCLILFFWKIIAFIHLFFM